MIEAHQDSLCLYAQLDNGIHEFVLTKASRPAVDEFMNQMDTAFQAAAPDEIIPCLMDWRQSGMPPLRYLSLRAKEFLKHYPDGPRGRSAYLHQPGALVNMAQTLTNLLSPNTKNRFFSGDQYDEAINWLLEG